MLQLKNIVKTYTSGEVDQHALNGVSLSFRENEFVSILGQSGSGKTTMLNIIGGLDRYTSGDLIINGISTREYRDADWDYYRNNSIGFVFQSYNLIPHQTVLTHISVMERTKEIGILRALGASKRNISQVFNAETFIIGCCAGLLGVGVSMLALVPINGIIEKLSGLADLETQLPVSSSLILIVISIGITIIGGLVPAKKAAKKDPVVALRTE